jgi:nicotinamide mononucleotide adenylyltransferase
MNGLTKHLVEGVLNEISLAPRIIFIYSGRFQPPHLGNKWVWNWLSKAKGVDNCFIATPNDSDPLTFAEKKSVFAAMGMDASKVEQSLSLYRAPSVMQKFDANKTSFVYVINEKDAETLPPRFKPYQEKMSLNAHISGESYYLIIPKEVFTVSGVTVDDDKVIQFLGSPKMDYKTSLEAFHKFFGFFDEHMYNVLVKKFEKVVEENISPIVLPTEQSSSLSPQCLRKGFDLDVNERTALAERMGVELAWVDELLKEDPDYVPSYKGEGNQSYDQKNAHPFFLIDGFLLLGKSGRTHGSMISNLNNEDTFTITKPPAWDSAYFVDELRRMLEKNINVIGERPYDRDQSARKFVCGRLWTDPDNVISFWSPRDLVLKHWEEFKKAWKLYPTLGDIEDYKIEWIESSLKIKGVKKQLTLDPVPSIDTSKTSSTPIDKDTADAYRELLKKQHIDPNAKKELAKIAQHPNKAAEIADELGMSVAELNHLIGVVAENAVKEIIKEDPDTVYDKNKKFAEMVENEAIVFIGLEEGTLFGAVDTIHQDLEDALMSYIYHREWTEKVYDFGYFSNQKRTERYLIIKGKYLAEPGRIEDAGRSIYKGLSGRIWPNKKVISFWQLPEEVRQRWKIVEDAFTKNPDPTKKKDGTSSHAGTINLGRLEDYSLDFINSAGNSKGLVTVPDFLSLADVGEDDVISPEEYKELLKKQHLDPEAKKKIIPQYKKAEELAKKMGYTSVAQMNADIHKGLDERLVKEDPDYVKSTEPDKTLAGFNADDASTFVAFEKFNVVTGMYHFHIHKALQEFDDTDTWDYAKKHFDDFDTLAAEEYLHKHFPHGYDGTKTKEGRELPDALAGRIWTEKKIVSVWDKSYTVKKHWKNVERLFKDHPEFGDIHDYAFDTLDRQYDRSIRLLTTSDFKKDQSASKDLDVSKLKDKVHVMDPSLKGQLMKMAMGATPGKKQEIADKLGITVAQLNQMNTIDEATNNVERPVIAIYSGRFQPFHVNHYKAYEEMVREFGQDKVFIVTSDKTEPGKSPFNFNQKVQIMTSVFGIPRKQIVEALHVAGDKTNRGPYYTIDKTAGQLSTWMKEIVRRAGVDQNNFGLVIGFGGKDEDRSRIAKSEYQSGQPVPNFLPEGNVQSFTIPMQDVEYKGNIINGTMIRNIITNHPDKINLLFKILYPKGVDPKTKDMITRTIQSSIAPVKKQKLMEGVQFGFIKHLEDMTPNELLDFFKLWNADATKFETFEKIDGNFYRFGLANGKFYVKDSKRSYADSAEYPDLYFYDDFRKFHQALQKIDWKKVLLEIGAEDTENFEADSEAVPHAHHNQVEYDGNVIGEGIVVVFGLTLDGEKKNLVSVKEFCESANQDVSPIKFHAIPKVDLSKVKFEDKTIETLETLITKHGNFLKKPARKPEEKELKQKVLGIVKSIAVKAKDKVLSTDIKSAFGRDYEGMVVHLPGGGMVKLVDKDKFTKSKDENWKVISDMEAVIKPIRDAMKKGETEGIADRLREAKKKIDAIYAEFKKNPESVKSEKKRSDTHKHYQLVQSQIDKALGELSKGSITEGGNAVAANTAIPRNYLETTIEYGLKLWGMDGVKYEPLGNINKAMLGDIDVGIDYKDMEKVLGVPFENQEEFWKAAQTKFSHQATKVPGEEPKYKIMKGLDIISVLTPVVSDEKKILPDQFCQIDLAIGDLQFMKAGRSGAPKDSKYKAMFRNILLADILSTIWREQIDPNTYRRYQINFSKGVQTADITKGPKGGDKKLNVKTLINDPDKLAELLFKGNTKWEDINGFEKLYKKLIGPDFKYPEKVKEIVDKFKVSIKNNKMDVPSEV